MVFFYIFLHIKNSQKGAIRSIINSIEQLIFPTFSGIVFQEIIDRIELEISLKCFLSQYLEKRIQGFSTIIGKIIESKNNDRIVFYSEHNSNMNTLNFMSNFQSKNVEKKHWLVPQNYLEWLETNQIFNLGISFLAKFK